MVRIRLKRFGSIHKPVYRMIVVDQRTRRDGRPLEEIGFYDPRKEPVELRVDTEAAVKWLKNGAQPSETAQALLKKSGVYEALKA